MLQDRIFTLQQLPSQMLDQAGSFFDHTTLPFSEPFSQSLYSRIEEFFDQEDLFITSCSPIISCTTLKPSFQLKKRLSQAASTASSEFSEEESAKNLSELAIPEFLKRRTSSSIGMAHQSEKSQESNLLKINMRQVKSLTNLPY